MLMLLSLSVKDKQRSIKLACKLSACFLNNFIEKQAVSTMPVNHVQSCVCHVTVLAGADSCLQRGSTGANASNMTAVDLTATGVTVNKPV